MVQEPCNSLTYVTAVNPEVPALKFKLPTKVVPVLIGVPPDNNKSST